MKSKGICSVYGQHLTRLWLSSQKIRTGFNKTVFEGLFESFVCSGRRYFHSDRSVSTESVLYWPKIGQVLLTVSDYSINFDTIQLQCCGKTWESHRDTFSLPYCLCRVSNVPSVLCIQYIIAILTLLYILCKKYKECLYVLYKMYT